MYMYIYVHLLRLCVTQQAFLLSHTANVAALSRSRHVSSCAPLLCHTEGRRTMRNMGIGCAFIYGSDL